MYKRQDLSYVDENELVKFYSDTPHRIFPRSANVIGREVKNCHPAKSVHVVEEIVEKFRSGEQSQAEFWINKPGLFIYVIYTAVRDENGKFRGVLEMMQDCTHIREDVYKRQAVHPLLYISFVVNRQDLFLQFLIIKLVLIVCFYDIATRCLY